jgi:hypothetical protein
MEEPDQFLALAVHVADDVVSAHVTSVSPGRDADSRARWFSSSSSSSSSSWFPSVNRGDLRH